jgi:hypothetical protein
VGALGSDPQGYPTLRWDEGRETQEAGKRDEFRVSSFKF